MEPFKKSDKDIIEGYAQLRSAAGEILEAITDEVEEQYALDHDGITYEQGEYVFQVFMGNETLVSPGVRIYGEGIIAPTFWIAGEKLTPDEARDLGFSEDEFFEGYYVKTEEVPKDFFELKYDDQARFVQDFFRATLKKLLKEGLIGPNLGPTGEFIAG